MNSMYVSPAFSAGLAVISKYPFLTVEPKFYGWRGRYDTLDGEIHANKGAIKVRICWNGYTVDLVVTHLVAESRNEFTGWDRNEEIRQSQTQELLQFVQDSCADADFVVLGGDFNFEATHESYRFVTEANFLDTGARNGIRRATWGHPENTWGNAPGHLLDYVFLKTNKNELNVQGSSTIPEKDFQFMMDGKPHSISDHSPVVADI